MSGHPVHGPVDRIAVAPRLDTPLSLDWVYGCRVRCRCRVWRARVYFIPSLAAGGGAAAVTRAAHATPRHRTLMHHCQHHRVVSDQSDRHY